MSYYNCSVCSTEQKFAFKRLGFDYYRCPSCRLVSTYPYPSDEEIEDHYRKKFNDGNYQLIQDYMQSYLSVYRDFADKLLKLYKQRGENSLKGKLALDIGCFTGDFLKILKGFGADVYGVELQEEAVQIANKSLNGHVYKADLLKNNFPQHEYDIVTMLGLIEHVIDPVPLIERAVSLLKHDGILMLQTPDSNSILARLMNSKWPPYAPVEHIHLFSKKCLLNLLRQFDFSSIEFYSHVKHLPVDYIFNNLKNFGPELYNKLHNIYKISPRFIKTMRLPFYGGEMVVIASRK